MNIFLVLRMLELFMSTAVEQAVACAPVTQRARVRNFNILNKTTHNCEGCSKTKNHLRIFAREL